MSEGETSSSKRPGKAAHLKPIVVEGKSYDPYHPPKLFKGDSGDLVYKGGKELDKDDEYAEKFWVDQPDGMREVMMDNILRAAEEGFISSFADPSGITEKDRQKLSAYRKLAREIGYEVGEYKFDPRSYVAQAPITKKASG